MRPPEFTGGNRVTRPAVRYLVPCFNEAAGIHRRKLHDLLGEEPLGFGASMRPPEFTGGNNEWVRWTGEEEGTLQ